jgi:L-fucose isomerase-like protein
MYLDATDPEALERIRRLARAGRIRRRLKQTRIGRFGPEPDGFASCILDEPALRGRLGVEVVQYELQALFDDVRRLAPEEIRKVQSELGDRIEGLQQLDQGGVEGTLGTYLALRRLAERDGLAGFAIRCWPEFFNEMHCAACGALSMLSDELTPASCESDINGIVTQLVLQQVAEAPVFDTDIVATNEELDGVVFWHCGKAPLSMADPEQRPLATVHSNRRIPLLMEFPLKPGPVTLARLSAATGEYRLVVGTGEMVRAAKSFTGTSGVCRFGKPAKEFMEHILEEGLEHHVALAYGEHATTLRTLAKLLELPVLEL